MAIRTVYNWTRRILVRMRRTTPQPPHVDLSTVSRQFQPIPANVGSLTSMTLWHFVSLGLREFDDLLTFYGTDPESASNTGPRLIFPWSQLGFASNFLLSHISQFHLPRLETRASCSLKPVLYMLNLSDVLIFPVKTMEASSSHCCNFNLLPSVPCDVFAIPATVIHCCFAVIV